MSGSGSGRRFNIRKRNNQLLVAHAGFQIVDILIAATGKAADLQKDYR